MCRLWSNVPQLKSMFFGASWCWYGGSVHNLHAKTKIRQKKWTNENTKIRTKIYIWTTAWLLKKYKNNWVENTEIPIILLLQLTGKTVTSPTPPIMSFWNAMNNDLDLYLYRVPITCEHYNLSNTSGRIKYSWNLREIYKRTRIVYIVMTRRIHDWHKINDKRTLIYPTKNKEKLTYSVWLSCIG